MTTYRKFLREALSTFESLSGLEADLDRAASACTAALRAGRKLLICGNGGSAAEAQHLAGELVGRYKRSRRPLAAVALTADSAVLTCIGNDYNYDDVFARQIHALAQPGDVLLVFTTSGNSPNVLAALGAARQRRLQSVAFLGAGGGKARDLADIAVIVAQDQTARVQEAHQFLLHSLMDQIEAWLQSESQPVDTDGLQ